MSGCSLSGLLVVGAARCRSARCRAARCPAAHCPAARCRARCPAVRRAARRAARSSLFFALAALELTLAALEPSPPSSSLSPSSLLFFAASSSSSSTACARPLAPEGVCNALYSLDFPGARWTCRPARTDQTAPTKLAPRAQIDARARGPIAAITAAQRSLRSTCPRNDHCAALADASPDRPSPACSQ